MQTLKLETGQDPAPEGPTAFVPALSGLGVWRSNAKAGFSYRVNLPFPQMLSQVPVIKATGQLCLGMGNAKSMVDGFTETSCGELKACGLL